MGFRIPPPPVGNDDLFNEGAAEFSKFNNYIKDGLNSINKTIEEINKATRYELEDEISVNIQILSIKTDKLDEIREIAKNATSENARESHKEAREILATMNNFSLEEEIRKKESKIKLDENDNKEIKDDFLDF